MSRVDPLGVRSTLSAAGRQLSYYSLPELENKGFHEIGEMPCTVKLLLESIVRHLDGVTVTRQHLDSLVAWKAKRGEEIPFKPARILMQDFTGVPAVVDLAAMRNALEEMGGDPEDINPQIPVDLIIDHSVQVDWYGSSASLDYNARREFERNRERYGFLRWASDSFRGVSVVPPATGICHQVNLEYLAKVIHADSRIAYPDTLLGTDSHTTMINGVGVLGWGVGGIEAEAAMLGQPVYIPVPEVVGFRLTGELGEEVTATDLVLTVTQRLR